MIPFGKKKKQKKTKNIFKEKKNKKKDIKHTISKINNTKMTKKDHMGI